MNERQKKLVEILDAIGKKPIKDKNNKKKSLSAGVAEMDDLLRQEGVLGKKPKFGLTSSEREELMEACLQMRTDGVETLNVCMSLNAFVISILSLIVSISSTVITLSKQESGALWVFMIISTVIIACILVILFSAWRTSAKNARKADQYRNAYLLLRFLQEQDLSADTYCKPAVTVKK